MLIPSAGINEEMPQDKSMRRCSRIQTSYSPFAMYSCHNSWFLTETPCWLSSGLCSSGQLSPSTVPGEYLQWRQSQPQRLLFHAGQHTTDGVKFRSLNFTWWTKKNCRRLQFSGFVLLGDNFSFLSSFYHTKTSAALKYILPRLPSFFWLWLSVYEDGSLWTTGIFSRFKKTMISVRTFSKKGFQEFSTSHEAQ